MAAWLPKPGGDGFDWQGDRPLGTPMRDLIIYEMHVRGFTEHPSSGVEVRAWLVGFRGLVGWFWSVLRALHVRGFTERPSSGVEVRVGWLDGWLVGWLVGCFLLRARRRQPRRRPRVVGAGAGARLGALLPAAALKKAFAQSLTPLHCA